MTRDVEIIGAGALSAMLRSRAKHPPAPGAICANCETPLQGFYCHLCGQSAHDQHRSIWHLAWEGVEGLTHLDGRLGQTVPPLFFNPGALARDHLEGRRQRHVPPFRLFLISLLIFMSVLEGLFHGATFIKPSLRAEGDRAASASPKTAAPASPVIGLSSGPSGTARPQTGTGVSEGATAGGLASLPVDAGGDPPGLKAWEEIRRKEPKVHWLEAHIKRAIANREYYVMVLFTWAHRLAILLLPILASLLALIYVRRRQFFIYDHLIVAMQFLSFEFLVFAVAWLTPPGPRTWALWIAVAWTPVNLFMTLRGAYGTGVVTAVFKTLFLWISTLVLFAGLMTGLLFLALSQM